jgi:hypothetical protein
MDVAVGSVPVQTGKLSITANVQMIYEILNQYDTIIK